MMELRKYQASDARTIIGWIRDEASFRRWCADRYDHYPITAEDMNRNYADCAENGGFFSMTAVDDGEIAGHLILRYTDEEKTVIRFGFIIVDDKKRGRGYGKEMLIKAIRYAFDELSAQKITLGVFENNPSAYHCYKAAGFCEVGKTEIYPVFGEEWNCIEMELVRGQDEEDCRSTRAGEPL